MCPGSAVPLRSRCAGAHCRIRGLRLDLCGPALGDTGSMKILLTSSSRHGATDEVAGAIAERLRASGIDVDRARPEDVTNRKIGRASCRERV